MTTMKVTDHDSRESRTVNRCCVCGKPITRSRQKTCSRACEGRRRNRHVKKRCLICGKEFEVSWSRRNRAKFCSVECRHRADRKVKRRPTKEQLEHLLPRLTVKEIAKQYGVTETAIKEWLLAVGLRPLTHQERTKIKWGRRKKRSGRVRGTSRGPVEEMK